MRIARIPALPDFSQCAISAPEMGQIRILRRYD
jgi:hypothetical protein